MTENEKQLINLIRENENSAEALMIATAIIIDYLKRHESSEAPSAACLQESA